MSFIQIVKNHQNHLSITTIMNFKHIHINFMKFIITIDLLELWARISSLTIHKITINSINTYSHDWKDELRASLMKIISPLPLGDDSRSLSFTIAPSSSTPSPLSSLLFFSLSPSFDPLSLSTSLSKSFEVNECKDLIFSWVICLYATNQLG